jgi:hypothetical protein
MPGSLRASAIISLMRAFLGSSRAQDTPAMRECA